VRPRRRGGGGWGGGEGIEDIVLRALLRTGAVTPGDTKGSVPGGAGTQTHTPHTHTHPAEHAPVHWEERRPLEAPNLPAGLHGSGINRGQGATKTRDANLRNHTSANSHSLGSPKDLCQGGGARGEGGGEGTPHPTPQQGDCIHALPVSAGLASSTAVPPRVAQDVFVHVDARVCGNHVQVAIW
jgi:hypothetical protein